MTIIQTFFNKLEEFMPFLILNTINKIIETQNKITEKVTANQQKIIDAIKANQNVQIEPILQSGIQLKIPVISESETIKFELPPWKQ